LPLLGDALPRLPDRIKQQLFEAFDLAMLYNKTDNQVTCRATITPATPAALTAIIAAADITDLGAYLNGHAPTGDLSRHPGDGGSPMIMESGALGGADLEGEALRGRA